jgi:hypothetical protein
VSELAGCIREANLADQIKSLLALSDLQIFTGIAIIMSGFLSLCPSDNEPNGLPAYYWQVLVHLAWLSIITQQGALLFTGKYFREHRWQRNFRLVLMAVLLVLLLAAMIPTAFFNWYSKKFPITITILDIDPPKTAFTYYSLARSAAEPISPTLCYFNISSVKHLFRSANPCRWGDFDIELSSHLVSAINGSSRSYGVIMVIMFKFTFRTRCQNKIGIFSCVR